MVVITYFAGMAAPVLMKMELEYAYACQDIPGIYVKHQVNKNHDKLCYMFWFFFWYVR